MYLLPYAGKVENADYLYFKGGYHSIPDGCTPWGISESRYNRFIGDLMGYLRIAYEDGHVDNIPLIFGHTLWFKSIWRENCAPFKSDDADPELTSLLKESLFLKGAFEGDDICTLCVKTRKGISVVSVCVNANSEKEGVPVFTGFVTENAYNGFFENHTVMPDNIYPETVKKNIDRINHALLTFEEDYNAAPVFVYPHDDDGFKIHFSGNNMAEIANGVIFHNIPKLKERIDHDGFYNASYRGAPSWRYEGFGPWVVNANSYCGKYYSRDAGRALMVINALGDNTVVKTSLKLGNQYMMYFPDNKMKIHGKAIPGHYTVILNEPLVYSKILRYNGWPTRYTEEKFGRDCDNLGNHETDGHGLMMMANYCAWENAPDKEHFFTSNVKAIKEAAEWILWCLQNPDVSLAENGLLYAESEGGMNQFTLYCNVPCCLGMYGYSKMAEYHGYVNEAEKWKACADKLYGAIIKAFSDKTGKWKLKQAGFQHDPVIVMLADIYGYDTRDMPGVWKNISASTYEDDMVRYRDIPIDGKGGIGYNSAMMTQNALLHDMTADYTKLAYDLCKISYAPRLPEPYLVPEGISYSGRLKAIRRQGDLGNLVQEAEVLKAFLIIAGVSPLRNGVLKIMPRLPKGWDMDIHDFGIQNTDNKISLKATYPLNGTQQINTVFAHVPDARVTVRFGPFENRDNIVAILNGNIVLGDIYRSGDAYWMDTVL